MKKPILILLVSCLLLIIGGVLGCCRYSHRLQAQTFHGPDGKLLREVTWRSPVWGSSTYQEWWKHRHGWDIFYDKDGKVEARGEWKDGKPWNGKCFIMAAGDAGSWGGIGHYENYEQGVQMDEASSDPKVRQTRP